MDLLGKMPGVVCNGTIKETLSSNLMPVYVASLKTRIDLTGKYLKAAILQIFTLHSQEVPSLKISVIDDKGDTIDVLALGQVANDLSTCLTGDTLCFLKFEVEKSPGHLQKPFIIVVDDTKEEQSLIWIFKETQAAVVTSKTAVKYVYKPLADVEVNTIVDVYGVVKFYKVPIKSRGTDFFCSISLVDPSLDEEDAKLTCNLFSRVLKKLPTPEVGNIIRFHRLKIKSYHGCLQGYNGPGFQWLVFRGSVTDRQSSSKSYTFEQHDEEKVKCLIDWWNKSSEAFVETVRTNIGQIKPKSYFNLVCQVVRICDFHSTRKLLSVWDGTKFDGAALKFVTEKEMTSTVIQNDMLMMSSKDLLVDVFIFDNHVPDASNIKPGDYVLLTNLHANVVKGLVELTLHGGKSFSRKIEKLDENCEDVENLKSVLHPLIQAGGPSQHQDSLGGPSNYQDCLGGPSKHQDSLGGDKEKNLKLTKFGKRKSGGNVVDQETGMLPAKRITCEDNLKENSKTKTISRVGNANNSCGNFTSGVGTELVTEDGFIIYDSVENLSEFRPSAEQNPGDESESECSYDSSSPSQRLWVSAYDDSDYERELRKLRKCPIISTQGNIQDKSISSTGKFKKHFPLVNESKSSTHQCSSHTSSQETFYTAPSPSGRSRVATDSDEEHISPKPNIRSAVVLSLKSQTNTPKKNCPFQQNSPGKKSKKKTLAQCTMLSDTLDTLDMNVPSFNSIQFAHESQHDPSLISGTYTIHSVSSNQDSFNGMDGGTQPMSSKLSDSQVTSSNEEAGPTQEQLRCMLKTTTTIVGHHHIPVCSITQVLHHDAPYKFRVQAQVQDFSPRPSKPADLVYLFCERCCTADRLSTTFRKGSLKKSLCKNCQEEPTYKEPTFIMTFDLSDGHNSLLAYLHGQDAVQFFNGITPAELLSNNEKFQDLEKCLDALCPSHVDQLDRPVMECCLVSYTVGQDIKYKIFDTVLVQDF